MQVDDDVDNQCSVEENDDTRGSNQKNKEGMILLGPSTLDQAVDE